MLALHINRMLLLGGLFLVSILPFLYASQPSESPPVSVKLLGSSHQILNITELLTHPSEQWQPISQSPKFELLSKDYWLKANVDLTNFSNTNDVLLLKINNRLLEQLSVYLGNDNSSQLVPLTSHDSSYQIPGPYDQDVTFYIRYRGQTPSHVNLTVEPAVHYIEDIKLQIILIGILIGLLTLAAGFYALVYTATSEKHYLHLACYLVMTLLLIASIQSFSSLYLSVQLKPFIKSMVEVLCILSVYFGHKHSALFFDTNRLPLSVLATIKWLERLLLIFAAITAFSSLVLSSAITLILCLVSGVIVTGYITMLYRRKVPLTSYYLIAWSALVFCLLVAGTSYVGIFSSIIAPKSLVTLAFGIPAMVFCYITSRHFFKQHQLAETKHQNIALEFSTYQEQQDLNQHNLEAMVDERTFELNMTLRELQETNTRLEEQTTIDALTGVKNRKFFDQRYQAELRLSRRQHSPISVLLLDADKFKDVNDNYGHLVGDQVLIEICRRATSTLNRPNDHVCRYGGEEFVILLPNTDSKGAFKVAESIRENIAKTLINADAHQLSVTVSIGVSTTIVEANLDPKALFSAADKALYKAKSLGRNKVMVADIVGSPHTNNI